MFKHNLLLAFRNFKRYKSSFFINLTGLSTGLACAMLIYLWVNDELSINKFHEKDSRLFQVMEHQQYAENVMTTSSTPGLLSEALVEEYPEFRYAATTSWIDTYTLTAEDRNVKADGFYTGKDYFNIFSYNLIQGDEDQVLADKNSIVISEELAIKLYDTTDGIIGKPIEFQHEKTFLISGIFEGTPRNSSFQFDFVLSFEEFKDNNSWVTHWGSNGPPTYVILEDGVDSDQLSKKIADFVTSKGQQTNVTLFLKLYSERYLYGRYENGVQAGGRIEYVRLFSIIAVFILLIACINFMNLSTARASRRAREVGIKKAIGARQSSLIFQFLGESIVITFLSLIIASLVVLLFLPQFNQITNKEITLQIDLNVFLGFIGFAIFTGLLSGSYPALYLSGFKPVTV